MSLPNLDTIPFKQARWWRESNRPVSDPINLVVWHTMESGESTTTAEAAMSYTATRPDQVSHHIAVDSNSATRSVLDKDVAFCAAGANDDGLQLELAGRAGQGTAGWVDEYSQSMLKNQAIPIGAAWSKKYDLPIVWVTTDMLLAAWRFEGSPPFSTVVGSRWRKMQRPGARGHTTHYWHNLFMKIVTGKTGSYTHWDPGPDFPFEQVADGMTALLAPPPSVVTFELGRPPLSITNRYIQSKVAVKALQNTINFWFAPINAGPIDGDFGPMTHRAVISLQEELNRRGHKTGTPDGVYNWMEYNAIAKDLAGLGITAVAVS